MRKFCLRLLINLAERIHDIQEAKLCCNNVRKLWLLINKKIGRVKEKSNDNLVVNNNMITDPIHIADFFNEFFAGIGTNLANQIKSTYQPTPTPDFNSKSFFVYMTNASEIESIILSMDDKIIALLIISV